MKLAPLAAMNGAVQLAALPRRERLQVALQGTGACSVAAVFTLVLWLTCLLVGGLGFVLPYARPLPPAPTRPTVVELLNVELSRDPLPDIERRPHEPPVAKLENLPSPPPAPAAVVQPDLVQPANVLQPSASIQPIAIAQPSPTIAFALPVEGPVRIVEARNAARAVPVPAPARPPAVPTPAAQPLTFGRGEGRQPAPDYPARAKREGQEGTVGVRLTVGEDGRVLAADAVSPSPWPMLNESAVRVVRQSWRFAAGRLRVYEVAIRFELTL